MSAEMQLFCQGGTGAFEFIQKLRAVGRSRANEFLKIAEHYEPLLADYGLTLGSLRAGYDDDFVEIERAARYDASDIQAPDQFSALAEALRLRGSGYRIPKPTNYVEFSALAKTAGVEMAEAAHWINSLQEPPILVPDLDWDSLRSFELNPLQRLILRRDSSSSSGDIALSVSEIDFSLLIHRAAELNESLSDIALAVRSMECIGIRVGFSDPVPDVAPDERDVSIVDALCKDGISCLLRLLSSRGKSSRATPLPPIARIAIWVRWVCSVDGRLPAVIDALQEFNEDLVGSFSSFTESIISSINNAAQNGNLRPAELIGIAGWAGISIATLRLTVAPFDRLLAAVGVAPAWFPDPIGTPPDWLDVALVDLLDVWPEKLDGWTEEIADFLVANVMADQPTIKERYDRWHDILVADPTRSDAPRSGG